MLNNSQPDIQRNIYFKVYHKPLCELYLLKLRYLSLRLQIIFGQGCSGRKLQKIQKVPQKILTIDLDIK